MGSYCEMSIDNVIVWSEKNNLPPGLEVVFLEEDKFENPISPDEVDDQELDVDIGYQVSLRVARFRLALCGYTIAKVKAKYYDWATEKKSLPDGYHKSRELSESFYTKCSFTDYATILKKVVFRNNEVNERELSTDEEYIAWSPCRYQYGFPSKDLNYVLALLLYLIDGENLQVNLSDMIAGELWNRDNQLDVWDNPLIILTEGKTDNEALRDSFNLLYPDHCRTIRFFDHDFRPEGGANNNVKLLKSFAAAGISNPILAIFDNDTAGHKALQVAKKLKLPNNFMLTSYPDIPMAVNYPTLGPSGAEQLDVNQSACGIEMYLGTDCLTKKDTLIPVRWTGYDEVMKRYQGEVGDKKHVLKLFRKKIKICQDDPTQISLAEWDELNSIMETVETTVLGEQKL